jgi:hypothetical protein
MNALLALIFGPFLQSKGLMKVEGDRPEFMPAARTCKAWIRPRNLDAARELARAINYGLHGPSRARFV